MSLLHDASTAWYGVHASFRYATQSTASGGGSWATEGGIVTGVEARGEVRDLEGRKTASCNVRRFETARAQLQQRQGPAGGASVGDFDGSRTLKMPRLQVIRCPVTDPLFSDCRLVCSLGARSAFRRSNEKRSRTR